MMILPAKLPSFRPQIASYAESDTSPFAPPLSPPHLPRVTHPRIKIHTRLVLFQRSLGPAIGKTLADSPAAILSANRAAVIRKSDGESFTSTIQRDNGDNPGLALSHCRIYHRDRKVQACGSRLLSLRRDSVKTCLCCLRATFMDATRSFHFGLVK